MRHDRRASRRSPAPNSSRGRGPRPNLELVTVSPESRPAEPGYILGFKEMALVDSKDPKAKPLPIAKMMVHHFRSYAPGRVNDVAGSCWSGSS